MEKPATFGATVRDRRLARGYSLGQLATKVHKTAASIRAWERGVNHPDDDEVAALAGALDLDAAALMDLLGSEDAPPADSLPAVAVADPWSEANGEPAAPDVPPEAAGAIDRPKEKARTAVAPDGGPTDVPPAGAVDSSEPADEPAPKAETAPAAIHEAMTEAVPVVAAGSVAVAATSSAPEADRAPHRVFSFGEGVNPILQAWEAAVDWYRQVFDPSRPWIYRVRIVLLVISLYVMLRVLGWALPHLWDAIQEVLDSISFGSSETPDVAS